MNTKSNVYIVMGVSATGKTTIGNALAVATKGAFFDGDDFHSEANRQKMASGEALTDGDRWPWLEKLAQLAADRAEAPVPSFIACSALKESYRRVLRSQNKTIRWIHLHADPELLRRRIKTRYDAGKHFMPPDLLDSQLEILETPREAILIDVAQSVEACVKRFLQATSSPGDL